MKYVYLELILCTSVLSFQTVATMMEPTVGDHSKFIQKDEINLSYKKYKVIPVFTCFFNDSIKSKLVLVSGPNLIFLSTLTNLSPRCRCVTGLNWSL